MPRWAGIFLSVLTLLCAACAPRVGQPDFPKSVSPGWQLEGVAAGQAGEPTWTARYAGPGTARVRVWVITSSEDGLARTQQWRAQSDTVVFSNARYFTAIDWSGVGRPQAGALVRGIERAMVKK